MGVVGVVALRLSRDDDVDRVRPSVDQAGIEEVGLRFKFFPTVGQPLSYDIDAAADRTRHPSRHSVSLAQANHTADQGTGFGPPYASSNEPMFVQDSVRSIQRPTGATTKGGRDSRSKAAGHRPEAESALRASWLSRSLERGWADPVGWRTPAVDGVVAALTDVNRSVAGLEQALRMLAWERASDILHLDTALDDLDALWAALESENRDLVPRAQARRWLVDAWVDAVAVDRGVPCLDPLSGLHTPGYLLGRVRELDRLCDGEPAPLVLLALRWHRPAEPWLRIGTVLSAATVLQTVVRRDATFAQDGTHTALALVPDDLRARVERAGLAGECVGPQLRNAGALADLVVVPAERDQLASVVRGLRLPVVVD
jgi:hypothetical protein